MENLFGIFTNQMYHAIAWMVIHSLWQIGVISLLVGVIIFSRAKSSPSFRYNIGITGLCLIIVSAFTTFAYEYITYNDDSYIFSNSASVSVTSNELKVARDNAEAIQSNSIFNQISLSNYLNDHIHSIVIIWFFGLLFFLMRILGGISYVYYIKNRMNFPVDEYWLNLMERIKTKLHIYKSIELLESALVRAPMVIGHFKPVILFPISAINQLEESEVEAILAHELAHIMRNDFIVNILQSIVEAVFYYHPAIWWLTAQVRQERENCCDDEAIKICGNSVAYAKSLVRVQEMAYIKAPSMAMAFSGKKRSSFFNRIHRILNPKDHFTSMKEKLSSFLVLISILLLASFMDSQLGANLRDSSQLQNKQKEASFIKFTNEHGQLDSFLINGNIKDGIYNYNDELLQATIQVKNNYVLSFNLNGIEQDKINFSKFSKLIDVIVEENQEKSIKNTNNNSKDNRVFRGYTSNPEILDENKNAEWYSKSLEGKIQQTLRRDDGSISSISTNDGCIFEFDRKGNLFKYTDKNSNITINQNDQIDNSNEVDLNIVKNGKAFQSSNQNTEMPYTLANLVQLEKLDDQLSKLNDKGDYEDYKKKLKELEKDLKKLKKEYEKLPANKKNRAFDQKLHSLEAKINSIYHTIDSKQHIQNYYNYVSGHGSANGGSFSSGYYRSSTPDWVEPMKEEMLKDGIIKGGRNGNLCLNYHSMKVNGEKQNSKVHKKYKDLYEKLTGEEIDEDNTISMCLNDSEDAYSNDEYSEDVEEESAYPSFYSAAFKVLINEGHVKVGKQVNISFTNKELKIDGKKLSSELKERLIERARVDSNNDKMPDFSIQFSGKINKVKDNHIELNGSLTTSFNMD